MGRDRHLDGVVGPVDPLPLDPGIASVGVIIEQEAVLAHPDRVEGDGLTVYRGARKQRAVPILWDDRITIGGPAREQKIALEGAYRKLGPRHHACGNGIHGSRGSVRVERNPEIGIIIALDPCSFKGLTAKICDGIHHNAGVQIFPRSSRDLARIKIIRPEDDHFQ